MSSIKPRRLENLYESTKDHLGVPDLCQLLNLDEATVLANLKVRAQKHQIYTSITTKVLIAVNPFQHLPENDSLTTLAKYQAAPVNLEGILSAGDLGPHVFTCGHSTYHNMIAHKKNQSIIVCGESGSGKTESAKLIMKFLAFTSTVTAVEPKEYAEAQRVGEQVLDANPILESFGNAKTVLNNNSSRFGKFTKMLFAPRSQGSQERQLVGAAIETYLLEKSRVCHQDLGERNYHVFYYVCSQARQNPEWRLGDGNPKNFRYLNQSGCYTLDGDSTTDDRDYQVLVNALDVIEFTKDEQRDLFNCVAGVLHLGNIEFVSKGDSCEIKDMAPVKNAAALFQIDLDNFVKRLLQRSITVSGSVIIKDRSKEDAEGNRDSFAKGLYNGLFRWIVGRINQTSCTKDANTLSWIGILDVFGFEIFTHNSFEQFCINFANERLQAYFNWHVLKQEQDLYRKEALLWKPISLPDNTDVIDLISSKPVGLLAILDSSCVQPKGSDLTFTENLFREFPAHRRLERVQLQRPKISPGKTAKKARGQFNAMNGFTIRHYAGVVTYDAKGFLSKNADSSHPDNINLFCDSKSQIASKLLSITADGKIQERPEPGKSMKFRSTSAVFNQQLDRLMETLDATTPHFVRCIKPNQEKLPNKFDEAYVAPQLCYGGVPETLRIIKEGFPTRCSYEKMYKLFGSIIESRFHDGRAVNKRDFTEAMVKVCGPENIDRTQYQLGLTMIFFRPGRQAFFQKILQLSKDDITARQRAEIEKFLLKKKMQRMKGAVIGYLRLKHFHLTLKFQKAVAIMKVIYMTMIRAMRRARAKLDGKRALEEEERRLKDRKILAALAAQQELEVQQVRWAKELREKEAALEQARREGAEAEHQIAKFMAKLQAMTTKLVELETQAQGERDAAQQALMEKQLYETELARLAREQDLLGRQNKETSAKLKIQQEQFENQTRKLQEEANRNKGEAQLLIDQLKADLKERENALMDYQLKAEELEQQLEEAREASSGEISKLSHQLADLEEEVARERETSQQLLAEKSDLEHQVRTSQEALEERETQARQLRDQIAEVVGEMKKLKATFEAALEDKKRADEMLARLQIDVKRIRDAKEEVSRDLDKALRQCKEQDTKLKEYEAASIDGAVQREALERALKDKTGTEAQMESELMRAKEEIAALKRALEAKDRQQKDMEKDYREVMDQQKDTLVKMERKFMKARETLEEETRSEVIALRADLANLKREHRLVVAKETEATQKLSLAQKTIDMLKSEMQEQSRKLHREGELEDEITALQDALTRSHRQAKAWLLAVDGLKSQAEFEVQRLDSVTKRPESTRRVPVTQPPTLTHTLSKSMNQTLMKESLKEVLEQFSPHGKMGVNYEEEQDEHERNDADYHKEYLVNQSLDESEIRDYWESNQ